MIIIITGAIGVGKSTVCRKLLEICRSWGYTCGGVLTSNRGDSLIIEDILIGKEEIFASTRNIYSGPRTLRYYFNSAGIEFGIKAIENGAKADFLFIDELGRLELNGEGFIHVLKIISQGHVKNCILVIRKELLPNFLLRLPPEPLIFETTVENRNRLPTEIATTAKLFIKT